MKPQRGITMKKNDLKKLKKYNRYEVRTITPHFGQTVVGIYQTLEEARQHKQLLFMSQDFPLVIYDTVKCEKVKEGSQ
tara:strand:+ start:4294 stop:4527 length:234 start_codon:yes stop_codon:yes gene_type:complete